MGETALATLGPDVLFSDTPPPDRLRLEDMSKTDIEAGPGSNPFLQWAAVFARAEPTNSEDELSKTAIEHCGVVQGADSVLRWRPTGGINSSENGFKCGSNLIHQLSR